MEREQHTGVLRLAELEQGMHRFSFELESAYFHGIEKSEIAGGNVKVDAELRLRADDYDLRIHAAGTVELICDRCLGTMEYAVDVTDAILPEEGDEEEGKEQIDLRWLAYELITTNLPIVHSHPEGECMADMQQLLQSHLCSTGEAPE